MPDLDEDDFYKGLAGEGGTDAASGSALAQTGRAVRRVLAAPRPLSEAERASRDALMQRLQAQGRFADPDAAPARAAKNAAAPAPDRPSWRRFLEELFQGGWRPIGVTAALVLAVVVGVRLAAPPDGEGDVVRGGDAAAIEVADAAAATALRDALLRAGASAELARINDTQWALSVEVPADPAVRTRVVQALASAGFTTPPSNAFTVRLRQRGR